MKRYETLRNLAGALVGAIDNMEKTVDAEESELRGLIANAKFWIKEIQKMILKSQR